MEGAFGVFGGQLGGNNKVGEVGEVGEWVGGNHARAKWFGSDGNQTTKG